MLRRSFLQSVAAVCALGAHTTQVSANETGAAARIGKHILATCSAGEITMLRQVSQQLPSMSSFELSRHVAADHRSGRIIKVDRIHFAITEAAWFVLLAEFAA